jgi:chemotaxis protein MotB
MKRNNLVAILIVILFLTSCVSQKKYNALALRCKDESTRCMNQVDDLNARITQLNDDLQRFKKANSTLINDTTTLASSLRVAMADNQELLHSYDLLKAQNSGNQSEIERVMSELNKRDEKLKSLQVALARNDSITRAMKNKVSDALLGFQGKGLSVYTKNGKVYVSMEEKLLFESAKWDVGSEGVSALKNLSKVLEKNPDINVMIEGHTDNVPFRGTGQVRDNWDLSVMRATSIVKILMEGSSIDPKRLITAGRSEYLPVDPDNTPAARAKNRRTDIILTPKLDELLQLIGTN